MLYDPRKEIGSKAHIIAWLEAKPADEVFVFSNSEICACGQYSKEFLGDGSEWTKNYKKHPFPIKNIHALNYIACHSAVHFEADPVTGKFIAFSDYTKFGDLLAAVKKVWAADIGDPERRVVVVPKEKPATTPAPAKPVKVPEKEPA